MIDPNELLYSVDEDNNPIEPQPRKLSHQNKTWHRAVDVWIVNSDKEILCQKRSMLKDENTGLWEPFFGGHLAPGQEYKDAAIKEVEEEVGLSINPADLKFFEVHKYLQGTEFTAVYALKWDGDAQSLKLEQEEVDQVVWFPLNEVRELVVNKQDTGWINFGYEAEMLDWLEKDSFQ